MALLTFKGGIHPDDGKDLGKRQGIVELKPTGRSGLSGFPAHRCACQADRSSWGSCFKRTDDR